MATSRQQDRISSATRHLFSNTQMDLLQPLVRADAHGLEDVLVDMHSFPSAMDMTPTKPAMSVDNLHFLIGHVDKAAIVFRDITAGVIKDLQSALDNLPPSARYQYEFQAKRWLDVAERRGNDYTPSQVSADRSRLDELLTSPSLSALVSQLGDCRHGLRGNLHVLNFVSIMGARPISLARAVEHSGILFRELLAQQAFLRITYGDPNESSPVSALPPGGGLDLQLTWLLHSEVTDDVIDLKRTLDQEISRVDRLESKLDELIGRLGQMDDRAKRVTERIDGLDSRVAQNDSTLQQLCKQLKARLLSIHKLVGVGGDIQDSIQTSRDIINSLSLQVSSLTQLLSSQSQETSQIKQQLDEIKQRVLKL